MKKEVALGYFQNLYMIAVADGSLAEEEKQSLVSCYQKMGINAREASEIMLNIKNLDFVIPEDSQEQENHLKEIIQLMLSDGSIHDAEYELCVQYAEKIGKSKYTVKMLIERELTTQHHQNIKNLQAVVNL
mgnify:CR=1 FL=1